MSLFTPSLKKLSVEEAKADDDTAMSDTPPPPPRTPWTFRVGTGVGVGAAHLRHVISAETRQEVAALFPRAFDNTHLVAVAFHLAEVRASYAATRLLETELRFGVYDAYTAHDLRTRDSDGGTRVTKPELACAAASVARRPNVYAAAANSVPNVLRELEVIRHDAAAASSSSSSVRVPRAAHDRMLAHVHRLYLRGHTYVNRFTGRAEPARRTERRDIGEIMYDELKPDTRVRMSYDCAGGGGERAYETHCTEKTQMWSLTLSGRRLMHRITPVVAAAASTAADASTDTAAAAAAAACRFTGLDIKFNIAYERTLPSTFDAPHAHVEAMLPLAYVADLASLVRVKTRDVRYTFGCFEVSFVRFRDVRCARGAKVAAHPQTDADECNVEIELRMPSIDDTNTDGGGGTGADTGTGGIVYHWLEIMREQLLLALFVSHPPPTDIDDGNDIDDAAAAASNAR
jgi:hypothetical protein